MQQLYSSISKGIEKYFNAGKAIVDSQPLAIPSIARPGISQPCPSLFYCYIHLNQILFSLYMRFIPCLTSLPNLSVQGLFTAGDFLLYIIKSIILK